MRHMAAVIFSTMATGATVSTPGVAADPLRLLYQDRPPYYVTNSDGSVGGLVSGPVSRALTKAGIKFTWVIRPGKRQIEMIKRNREQACSPGWFRKPQRELFAKFSDPIYQDRPQVEVIRAADTGRFTHKTLNSLFADPNAKLGAKLGYSYGTFVDSLMESRTPNMLRTPQDVAGMTRMLLGRRFDYLLAAPEEFSSLMAKLGERGKDIAFLELNDIPPGNKRYLMCSNSVGDDVIMRFNEALAVAVE